MKSYLKYLLIIAIIFLFINLSLNCTRKAEDKCIGVDKKDLLVKDILKNSKLFVIWIDSYYKDSLDNIYIASSNLIKPGTKIDRHPNGYMFGNSKDTIIQVIAIEDKQVLPKKMHLLHIHIKEANADSTNLKIIAGSGGQGVAYAEGIYQYTYNNDSCKWYSKELDFFQY